MNIRVVIADSQLLIREGLRSILLQRGGFDIVAEAECFADLKAYLIALKPDMVIMDPTSFQQDQLDSLMLKRTFSTLCLTDYTKRDKIAKVVQGGVDSYIFKDCDRQEIEEAITATSKGEKYFCGKVLHAISVGGADDKSYSCKAVNISTREAEIIKLIAEGNTNKEIADKLFLSNHTITTHRKNIMNKLGINNTAGLVLFAIKENLVSSPV